MNSPIRFTRCSVPLALGWSHEGTTYRVTPWPEVQVERRYGDEWVVVAPSVQALHAAASAPNAAWRAGYFRGNRIVALQVAARCPDLVGALSETPALIAFLAAHSSLRGTPREHWSEVNAIFERGGVFAVLEWLGLPASRQTLAILTNLVAADLPEALLEPLRALLWRPRGIFALAQRDVITERDVTDACALAA